MDFEGAIAVRRQNVSRVDDRQCLRRQEGDEPTSVGCKEF
jgi:hypothetical protein